MENMKGYVVEIGRKARSGALEAIARTFYISALESYEIESAMVRRYAGFDVKVSEAPVFDDSMVQGWLPKEEEKEEEPRQPGADVVEKRYSHIDKYRYKFKSEELNAKYDELCGHRGKVYSLTRELIDAAEREVVKHPLIAYVSRGGGHVVEDRGVTFSQVVLRANIDVMSVQEIVDGLQYGMDPELGGDEA